MGGVLNDRSNICLESTHEIRNVTRKEAPVDKRRTLFGLLNNISNVCSKFEIRVNRDSQIEIEINSGNSDVGNRERLIESMSTKNKYVTF